MAKYRLGVVLGILYRPFHLIPLLTNSDAIDFLDQNFKLRISYDCDQYIYINGDDEVYF